jgi:ankyrin repeat protein
MNSTRPEWFQLKNALEQGDVSLASSLLEKDSTLIDERNGIGESVLHFLAVENNRHAVQWLHTQGSDLNAVNEFGTPLLFEVALLGYRELFIWLVEHGADPNKTNAEGQRIEDYLAEFSKAEMIDFIKQHFTL